MCKTNVKLLSISLASITNNYLSNLDVPNKCVLCRQTFEKDDELLMHIMLQQHKNNIKMSSADSIKESREKEKLDYYDETVVAEKLIYKSKWEYDEKEGDNVLCNPGGYPDPDD